MEKPSCSFVNKTKFTWLQLFHLYAATAKDKRQSRKWALSQQEAPERFFGCVSRKCHETVLKFQHRTICIWRLYYSRGIFFPQKLKYRSVTFVHFVACWTKNDSIRSQFVEAFAVQLFHVDAHWLLRSSKEKTVGWTGNEGELCLWQDKRKKRSWTNGSKTNPESKHTGLSDNHLKDTVCDPSPNRKRSPQH